jgi:purine-binding chemotaxis protein CheW
MEKANATMDLTTFYLGDACFGVDILLVQEINKLIKATRVPLAPIYVIGILNLRGQIITVIDVAVRLGLFAEPDTGRQKNIIVRFQSESIGLLVDRIGDVIHATSEMIEKSPGNVGGDQGQFIEGIVKCENHLIRILNLDELLG